MKILFFEKKKKKKKIKQQRKQTQKIKPINYKNLPSKILNSRITIFTPQLGERKLWKLKKIKHLKD